MFRFVRRLFRPIGRAAALFLLWEHRKSVAMAARSIRHEIDGARTTGRWDVGRWKSLSAGMWHARSAAERGTVRSVIVDDAFRAVPLATNPVSPPPSPAGEWNASDADLGYTNVG